MKLSKIRRVLVEVNRFQKKANAAIGRLEDDKYAKYGCKETGALKRASLDLTRSLAQMRKP